MDMRERLAYFMMVVCARTRNNDHTIFSLSNDTNREIFRLDNLFENKSIFSTLLSRTVPQLDHLNVHLCIFIYFCTCIYTYLCIYWTDLST